tara:strand:- start:64 stop:432 length:369 start_codon:yes stop_codon:yes gene_type:complete
MKENLICIRFINQLKDLEAINQIKAEHLMYFHIPNGGSRKSSLEGYQFKIIGVLPGVADYQFMWSDGSLTKIGFIEFKTAKGKQQPTQKAFEEKCKLLNIPYEIARSTEDGINILKEWQILK